MDTWTHAVLRVCRIAVFLAGLFITPLGQQTALAEENSGKEGWPTHLRVLTGPNGGQWFMMGDPIAEVLSRHVAPASSRIGGGLANIGSISSKRGDIAFSLSCFMEAARSGEEEYQSIDLSNATLMARIYPQVMYFLLRKDFAEKHGITDVASLLQKKMPLRFASLKPGTASEFLLGLLLKHGYNTGFEQLKNQGWDISFNNYAETADNFVSGELDCFAYTAGTEVPLILTMEQHTDVIILPLDTKVLDMLSERFNTETYTIQPGVYRSITEPVKTLGDYTILIVRKDLPEGMVYAINKALWEGRDYIAGVIKDFGQLSPKTALTDSVPAHPGAVRFWTELRQKEGK